MEIMNERLIHDVSWSCVSVIEEMLGDALPLTAVPEFRAACYEAIHAAFEYYELNVERQARRLRPMQN
jgi:hypothetical protein